MFFVLGGIGLLCLSCYMVEKLVFKVLVGIFKNGFYSVGTSGDVKILISG